MSRFPGWTMKDVERLSNQTEIIPKNIPPKKLGKISQQKDGPDYVAMISAALTALKIEHEREYKFLHDRRFRFDIALPKNKIAIEFEGGIFTNGAHTRGKHYASDAKKYNLAVMHGWKLLRYTTADTNKINWEYKIADEIKELIETD